MSVRVIDRVLQHFRGDPSRTLLAVCIADFANDDGSSIFPSIATLARKSRQSVRTVQRRLREFESSGWLVCVRRSTGGKSGSTSQYRIAAEWLADPENWAGNDQLKVDNPCLLDTPHAK